jgi:hypothetical protein
MRRITVKALEGCWTGAGAVVARISGSFFSAVDAGLLHWMQ